jgi:hypothetical protein
MLLVLLELSMASSMALAVPITHPCHTPVLLEQILDSPGPVLADGPMPPPGKEKLERDPYDLPNSEVSENFVIRWGSGGGVQQADVDNLIVAFEQVWLVEVEEMEHPVPLMSDTHKFNVIIGDSGSGAPSSFGAAGYYTVDGDGYPYIVIAPGSMADHSWADTVAAHELYHAVQHATGSYDYVGEAAWYWEATATWIESEVYPENPAYAVFLFGFAYLPHLPLNFFDYPDTGALQEYRQYGAFIFPRYVAEFHGGWPVVRNTWVAPIGGTRDPIEGLRAELELLGVDFDTIFQDFASRNATWDYEHGSWYASALGAYAGYFGSQDESVADKVSSVGTGGWVSVDEDLFPQRYGYNIIEMTRPPNGTLIIDFEGDADGSRGSEAAWQATVVRDMVDGSLSYTPLEVTDGAASLVIEDASGDDDVYLVLSASSWLLKEGEGFGYRYRFTTEGVEEEEEEEDTSWIPGGHLTGRPDAGACGCAQSGSGLAWLWGAPLGALLLRRRRRR